MAEQTTRCFAKHTKYEPDLEKDEWYCPKCGFSNDGNESFAVQDSDPDASEECPLLHEKDTISCEKCGYETTGRAYVLQLLRIKNLVKCPCCKGKGFVDKDKPFKT